MSMKGFLYKKRRGVPYAGAILLVLLLVSGTVAGAAIITNSAEVSAEEPVISIDSEWRADSYEMGEWQVIDIEWSADADANYLAEGEVSIDTSEINAVGEDDGNVDMRVEYYDGDEWQYQAIMSLDEDSDWSWTGEFELDHTETFRIQYMGPATEIEGEDGLVVEGDIIEVLSQDDAQPVPEVDEIIYHHGTGTPGGSHGAMEIQTVNIDEGTQVEMKVEYDDNGEYAAATETIESDGSALLFEDYESYLTTSASGDGVYEIYEQEIVIDIDGYEKITINEDMSSNDWYSLEGDFGLTGVLIVD